MMGRPTHPTSIDLDGMVYMNPADAFGTDLALTHHYQKDDYFTSHNNLSFPDEIDHSFLWYNSEEASPTSDGGFDFPDQQLEIGFSGNQVLNLIRRNTEPSVDQPVLFTAIPVAPDSCPKDVASFYLTYCPKTTDKSGTRPEHNPVAANFSIPLTTPACFHIAQVRSAECRLSNSKFTSEAERMHLEISMIQHKGEAINAIRKMHDKKQHSKGREADELLASTISLGTLERYMGTDESASMHFMAVRRILKSIGGPLHIESVLLSRLMANLECTDGTTPQSYVQDQTEFPTVLTDLNSFFARIHNLSRSLLPRKLTVKPAANKGTKRRSTKEIKPKTACTKPLHTFGPQNGSVLRDLLDRNAQDPLNLTQQDRLELISQLTTALILCTVIIDRSLDRKKLRSYLEECYTLIEKGQFRDQPGNDISWLLQINDHSERHSQRIWQVASWVWLLKHVNYGVQCTVKNHVLNFLYGSVLERVFKLDSFHFSYAC